ncbi:LamB/YcsF family protein [Glaciibacter flavus]|uniref:LamB/YcsF family protein n=1 Tax=Orlajensenia flava TaxID=2565934 RepID=A0A4S4FJW1_9MICO|nr:5-oxoprolinase subunit PxpA [Glaciibacter flavus]THG30408.1 LamB/YcsF family protein [Glaciibacter flavus]
MDLNCDLGEGFDDDEALFALVSSANIACGGHAGDDESMRASCRLALANGVSVGAHPSYPDREHFGRRPMELDAAQLTASVLQQIGRLRDAGRATGVTVRYVKPHGALYNRIAVDVAQADAVAAAVAIAGADQPLMLLGPAGSLVADAAARVGVAFQREAFIDRAYNADGTLVSRETPGAVIGDPEAAARRAVAISTTARIDAIDGRSVALAADSLCVHGDTPGAVEVARAVRAALGHAGVAIGPFS